MGISFDYGSHKVTKGEMILFSDPVSEVNLRDEIRAALESRLCFYAYRMPGDMMVSFGSSEGVTEGLGEPGFVIAPFMPGEKVYTIPYRNVKRAPSETSFQFPTESTTKEEYTDEIAVIQKYIDGSDEKKVVAARVKIENLSIDVGATFLSLTKAYPKAYVFCFSTPQTGCWIGASPELLLQRRDSRLDTMALAGTRPAGTAGEWDAKNIKEQRMVTDYILECFSANGLTAETKNTFTRQAGNIEHICTPVAAQLKESSEYTGNETLKNPSGKNIDEKIQSLIFDLSPTPALAGLPKNEALQIISKTEKFKRSYYGGFCGPVRSMKEFTLFVTLRCARIETDRVALFAGGGITAESQPSEEWEETEMKLASLSRLLQTS